jgi:hypothetical protein
MRCSQFLNNGRGRRCKRNACDDSDFCKQHNPLNKMDDITCAICLDDIKDPLKTQGCRHIFCKMCLANSALRNNTKCPCCRSHLGMDTLSTCIEVVCGKQASEKFKLDIDMQLYEYKWSRPWTKTMQKRVAFVYPEYLNCV